MTTFKKNQVLILLGAGASVDVGIPHAQRMVEELDGLVCAEKGEGRWRTFKELFNYIKSAVHYADGVRGLFGPQVQFNIERLVNTLEELNKKETHPLYPFVGAWNPKLVDVAGPSFDKARDFRAAIVQHLRERWLAVDDYEGRAGYYRGLLRFQREYEFPLRVFSLNYDLCVERVCGNDQVQRGFEGRRWDWRLFDDTDEEERKPLLLYKLHGSTDWTQDADGNLTYVDDPARIPADGVAIIFGTTYKLQYVDPFLFFAYELRRWTLDQDARIIVAVGYGFGDDHINGILGQSLRQGPGRRLYSVAPFEDEQSQRTKVAAALGVSPEQVVLDGRTAMEFLERGLSIATLSTVFPEQPEIVPEIPATPA